MALTTARVWTRDLVVAGNTARQLLVPNGSLDVLGEGERLTVSNRFGQWRATHDTTEVAGDLAAVLPRLSSSGRVSWVGNRLPFTPEQVVESHRGAFEFRSFEEPNSLRRPQIGALHSIMGYWSSGLNAPGIVVMPTGTGKTETMLALLVAARPGLLLVIVPTVALRDQIAGKFESLGVLQELQIVSAQAQRPVVGRLAHGLPTAEEADQFASACNVIVATPPALAACSDEARSLPSNFALSCNRNRYSPQERTKPLFDVALENGRSSASRNSGRYTPSGRAQIGLQSRRPAGFGIVLLPDLGIAVCSSATTYRVPVGLTFGDEGGARIRSAATEALSASRAGSGPDWSLSARWGAAGADSLLTG